MATAMKRKIKKIRTATRGSVEVMSRGEVMGCARWASAFAGRHKDHRYYELVEDTIQPDFVFRYFAIKDEDGSVRAVQPFFIIDQDLLLGTNTRLGEVIGFIRRLWPRFPAVKREAGRSRRSLELEAIPELDGLAAAGAAAAGEDE
jgi:hypothetical protein